MPAFNDACKTNVRARLFRANFKECFVSGHDTKLSSDADSEAPSPSRDLVLTQTLKRLRYDLRGLPGLFRTC